MHAGLANIIPLASSLVFFVDLKWYEYGGDMYNPISLM